MSELHGKDLFLRMVFPDRCISCLEPVEPGTKMCSYCIKTIKIVRGERCPKCLQEKKKCKCSAGGRYFDRVIAPFDYDGTAKNIIWHWKFEDNIEATDFLAQTMYESLKQIVGDDNFDCICYIPQTDSELKERKFNQSKFLAECLSILTNTDVSDCLTKTRNTSRQHTLPSMLKFGNVFGCFKCTEDMTGKRVLLVDDILTTGNTMNECAKMLKINDADEVVAITFAAAVQEKKQSWDTIDDGNTK